jgi:hypothetical protein
MSSSNTVTLLNATQFDLLEIYNMNYRELQLEIKKFNMTQPEANRIRLVQKRCVLLSEFMHRLELLGAIVPENTPTDDVETPLDDVMNSLNSLSICLVVTLT